MCLYIAGTLRTNCCFVPFGVVQHFSAYCVMQAAAMSCYMAPVDGVNVTLPPPGQAPYCNVKSVEGRNFLSVLINMAAVLFNDSQVDCFQMVTFRIVHSKCVKY